MVDLVSVDNLLDELKLGYIFWIPAFAGMTECRGAIVIPAKAGIQCSDYSQSHAYGFLL